MMADFFIVIDSIDSNGQSAQRCEKTDQYTNMSCLFELQWHSKNATHRDCHFQQRLNFWQNYFPPELEALMTGKTVGHSATIHCEPGRLVPEYHSQTSSQIAVLYRRLIGKGDSVLDLMASWKSHLPENLVTSQVTGLGMNHEELANNPKLDEFVIHDLNENPILPFESEKFETVVCALSIEYLIKPREVFAEVHRVLKPGGHFIVTFSNRWFPTKSVRIWENLHDYERMGLVLEYLMSTRRFADLHTWSIRGLPRPKEDKYTRQMMLSDPLYAVWGVKEINSYRS